MQKVFLLLANSFLLFGTEVFLKLFDLATLDGIAILDLKVFDLVWQAEVVLSSQQHLVFESETELVHVKMLEESVLSEKIDLLYFLKSQYC